MDLFDDEQVTTTDKIDRPERAIEKQAIDDFMKRNPQADGGRIEFDAGGDAVKLKALQADYDKFGKKELNKAAKTLGFKDYASMSGQENNNFRRKIKNELTEFGSVLDERESRIRSRGTRIPKEQGIQIKLLEATNKKKFFDPKAFAKENKISMGTLKKQAALLQKNIYNKRMKVAGKDMRFQLDWIPNDPTASDNALNKLWKSKLIKYEKNKIDELFYQSFGNSKSPTYNPKKFLAIKKNLNEYRQLRDAINVKYPNINFELDHPLSKSSLNKLFNATTEQLTRVNVLEADLNNGFKDTLSLQYEKAVQGNNLNKKKAVEKIARDLKLNIGKISDDATNFKYGVKEFQKLNIKDEIGKSLQNLNALNKNFQTYAKNNPDLFKTAGVSTQQTFTKIDNVKGLVPFMKNLGIKCQLSSGINCSNPQAYTKSLNELSEKAAQGNTEAASKLKNFSSKALKTGKVLKNVLGPLAVASEIALEGGIALNKTLETGVPFKQAFGESYLNKLLGPKLQIDVEAERAKEMAKGEEYAMAERGRRMAPFMAQSKEADAQRLKKREEEIKALYPQLDFANLSNKEIDKQLADSGVYSPYTLGFGMQQRQPGIRDNMKYNEDLAYDELREYFNKMVDKDIKSQQMQTIADAGGVSNLAKGGRAGFKFGTRKGVLSLIDKSVKSTPKDTTTQLDKLIKETLDKDFFDKKDRIVDTLNAKAARERKKYSYNQKVQEEPSQLNFYDDIVQSNFRDKTGPFFDYQKRKNKAGGGILKQAGDSSGPPPESGPNSQGLQGLMKRGIKI